MRDVFASAVLFSAIAMYGCAGSEEPVAAQPSQPTKYGAPTAEFIQAIAVDTPTRTRPIAFGGTIAPASVSAGEPAILVVRGIAAEDWHINEVGGASEMLIPTSLHLDVPPGIELVDSWQLPTAEKIEYSEGPVYHGEFVFFHHLRIASGTASGTYEVLCTVDYQACDNMKCLPPTSEKLRLTVRVN